LRQAIALNALDDFFKEGPCRITNLSNKKIQLTTAEEEKILNSFEEHIMKGNQYPEMRVPILIKVTEKGKWRRAYSTTHKLNLGSRIIITIL
tara:strand:- start:186 stop:461 length:276 start_codon:yes stop_codon:yes gene_type:complete